MPILRLKDVTGWLRDCDTETEIHVDGAVVRMIQRVGSHVRTGILPVLTDFASFSVKADTNELVALLKEASESKYLRLSHENVTLTALGLPSTFRCKLSANVIPSCQLNKEPVERGVPVNMDWLKSLLGKVSLTVGRKLYWNTSIAFLSVHIGADKVVCIGSDGICLGIVESPIVESLAPVSLILPDRSPLDAIGGICTISVDEGKATLANSSSRVTIPQPEQGSIPWRAIKKLIGHKSASMLTIHKEPLRRLSETAAKRKGLRHCRLRIEGERLSMFTDSDLLYVQKCHDGADCRREENLFPLAETISIHNPDNFAVDLVIDAALLNPILGRIDSEFIDLAVLEQPTLTLEIRSANEAGLRYFLPVKTK